MLKYVNHENSEDGQKTILTLADDDGRVHRVDLNEIPLQQIDEERETLARLNHEINHWGYEPPECCHCCQLHAFSGIFCALDHPMDYFRVYCATCPDVNKEVKTVWNEPPKFFDAGELPAIDISKAEIFVPKPPTREEIEKTRRENHCRA